MAKDPARELRSAIALSKKIPLNYGYCLGIDPWEAVWVTHKRKTAATLARQAKKTGNTAKTIYGVMSTTLNIITLTCEKPPPGRVAYNAKFFLKEFGLKYKIRLIGPEGDVLEESDTDMSPDAEDDDAAAPSPEELAALEATQDEEGNTPEDEPDEDDSDEDEAPEPEDPDAGKWEAARATLEPKVMAALSANHPRADGIERLWAALNSRADAGKSAAALAAVPTLVKLVSAQSDASPTLDPALVARFKAVAKAMKAQLAAAPERKSELMALFAPARSALEAKDGAALALALDTLEAALTAALATPATPSDAAPQPDTQEPETPAPDPAVIAAELREIWSAARKTTDAQLAQLLSKITADGTDEGHAVSQIGLTAWAQDANAQMDAALTALAATSPKRLKTALGDTVDAISGYAGFLDMHPAVEVIEENTHGVPVSLSSTLGGALTRMRARARLD